MKIVLTVHQFLPDFAAGTEILTFDTATELQRRGHEVVVWTAYPTHGPSHVDEYEYQGIAVHRYHFNAAEASANSNYMEVEYNNRQFYKIFSAFLKAFSPDIIHFFHLGRLSSSAIEAGHEAKIAQIFTATDFWMACPTNQLRLADNSLCSGPSLNSINCIRHVAALSQPKEINDRLDRVPDGLLSILALFTRWRLFPKNQYTSLVSSLTRRKNRQKNVFNLLDRVLAPTHLMENILIRNGLDRTKVEYQPYGINLQHVYGAPAKSASTHLRIGFIGTIYEHKGVHILLEAVKMFDKDVPIEVKIYGKEDEFPEYVSKLKGIIGDDHRVRFCGTFPNNQIGQIFSGIDVLVVPSIWYENAPLVAYSAQSTGTPVIATNLGGLSEIISHGQNGLLFNKGDVAGLHLQLRKMVENTNLSLEMGSKSIRQKPISQYVDELEETYKSVI